MVNHTLTVQIVNNTNEPFAWWLLVDGQSLGDEQSSYTVVLPEGNHVIELPIVAGAGYASIVWRDQAGNILGNNTALSLNLISNQQITLLLELRSWIPTPWSLFLIIGIATLGLGYVAWRAIKRRHK